MKKCEKCEKKKTDINCTLCRLKENKEAQDLWVNDSFADNYRKIAKLLVKKNAMKQYLGEQFKFEKKIDRRKNKMVRKRENYPCRGFKIHEIPDKWCLDCPTKKCRFEYADEIGIGW